MITVAYLSISTSNLEYSQRLNWSSAGQEIKHKIDKLVVKSKS